MIPDSATVTLETAMGIKNVEDDLAIMKKLGWKGFGSDKRIKNGSKKN